jgi:hypothetical protein
MKKSDVHIGSVYTAKVSDALVPVRVLRESPYGGWECRNEKTGRMIRVRSAQRFRGSVAS